MTFIQMLATGCVFVEIEDLFLEINYLKAMFFVFSVAVIFWDQFYEIMLYTFMHGEEHNCKLERLLKKPGFFGTN